MAVMLTMPLYMGFKENETTTATPNIAGNSTDASTEEKAEKISQNETKLEKAIEESKSENPKPVTATEPQGLQSESMMRN